MRHTKPAWVHLRIHSSGAITRERVAAVHGRNAAAAVLSASCCGSVVLGTLDVVGGSTLRAGTGTCLSGTRGGVNTEQIRRGRANAGASGAVFFSLYFYLHSVHLRVVAWWGRRLVGASHV